LRREADTRPPNPPTTQKKHTDESHTDLYRAQSAKRIPKPVFQLGNQLRTIFPFSPSFWTVFSTLFDHFLAHFWPISGQLLASFWPAFGQLLASFWPAFGQLLASFWPASGQFLASFWLKFGSILGNVKKSRLSRGGVLGTVKITSRDGKMLMEMTFLATSFLQGSRFEHFLSTFWLISGQFLASFWPVSGQLLASFWPAFGQLLTSFWPAPGQLFSVFCLVFEHDLSIPFERDLDVAFWNDLGWFFHQN